MREYEVMVILDAEADDKAVKSVADRIAGVLQAHGGEVTAVNPWGRRKLAFEIGKRTEGFYAVIEFKEGSGALGELDRVLTLADDIVRFKVLRKAA